MLLALLVFASAFARDYAAALYTQAVANKQRPTAIAASMAILFLSYFCFRPCFENAWYLVPAMLGVALGTWAAMRR